MSDRLEALARRRVRISAEIARHRHEVAEVAQRLQPPLRRIERVREDLRFFRERYVYLLIPVALLVVLNPGRTLKLALGAFSLWQNFQRAPGDRNERLAHALSSVAAGGAARRSR
jgi:hypothetical protein